MATSKLLSEKFEECNLTVPAQDDNISEGNSSTAPTESMIGQILPGQI